MDQEVAKTLGELELKLQQLEHELTSIGPHDAKPDRTTAQAVTTPSDASRPGGGLIDEPPSDGRLIDEANSGGRLVDEAMESSQAAGAIADGEGLGGGPPMFGGEEVPAQPAETGQDWKVDVRETAYGEIPSDSDSQSQPYSGPLPGRPGPPIPPPSPTPQPPPTTPPGPPPPTTPPGPPSPEHPPAPAPPPAGPQPIDRAELVRFKQHLEQTMAELSEQLARLLLPKPPA